MKKLIIFFSITLYATIGFSQQIWFEKTYDFGNAERGQCVKQTPDSGYVVAGWQGIGPFSSKMVIMKTDKHGTLQWSNLIGDGSDDRYAYYITNCANGGYAAVGFISGSGFSYDIYVIRLDNNGDTIWTRHYGTPLQERGYCIQETSNHNFVITYASADTTGILKIDSVGNLLWWKKYLLYSGASFHNVFELSSGGYLLSGVVLVGSVYDQGLLMRTDTNGDSIWTKKYGVGGGTQFYEAQETLDGNIIVGGITLAPSVSSYDSYVLKLNYNGDTLWTKRFGSSNDGCMSIDKCSDGGYIVAGTLYNNGNDAVFLTKTNSLGDSLWTREFGGPDAGGNFVRQTYDGGYIITGIKINSDATGVTVCLVKTDSLGNTNVGINEIINHQTTITLSPNPFTSQTILSFSEQQTNTTVLITNLLGEEIKTIPHVHTKQLVIEKGEMKAGIYFVQTIDDAKRICNKKMVVE